MSPEIFAEFLEMEVVGVCCPAPQGTVLHHAGKTVCSMVAAYLRDGKSFYQKGDAMNALAAFAYATGWLEAGYTLGLITSPPYFSVHRNGFTVELETSDRLLKKVNRYHRLMEQGIRSLEIAPDPASELVKGAEKVLEIASSALFRGIEYEGEHRPDRALWCFSYGHGWLDAGVRTGLFRIIGDRTLFTI